MASSLHSKKQESVGCNPNAEYLVSYSVIDTYIACLCAKFPPYLSLPLHWPSWTLLPCLNCIATTCHLSNMHEVALLHCSPFPRGCMLLYEHSNYFGNPITHCHTFLWLQSNVWIFCNCSLDSGLHCESCLTLCGIKLMPHGVIPQSLFFKCECSFNAQASSRSSATLQEH